MQTLLEKLGDNLLKTRNFAEEAVVSAASNQAIGLGPVIKNLTKAIPSGAGLSSARQKELKKLNTTKAI